MANRLAQETSPYLLQHADNPVDWYPWGDEAFARAREEDKPILLSVGYSACHWCHVMEHESFEDEETAALMNERFVNVKVDREERPDVDASTWRRSSRSTGQRRLADDRLPHARRPAVLRRHVLPARAAARACRASARCSTRSPTPTASAAASSTGRPRLPDGGDPRGRAACRPRRSRSRADLSERRARHARRERSTPSRAASAARRSSRPPRRSSSCCAPRTRRRGARHGAADARRMAARRHVRPPRRRLPPLLGRRRSGSSPTSRRCSTTTRCSPRVPARLGR